MRQIFFLHFFILIIIVSSCGKSESYNGFPEKPENGFINDEGEVLTSAEENILNEKLTDFANEQSFEIFIYTGKTFGRNEMEPFTETIESKWEIGQDTDHGGVLIALFTEVHESGIEVSSTGSIFISDDECYDVLHNTMRPWLDSNAFYDALLRGTENLMSKIEWKLMLFAPATEKLLGRSSEQRNPGFMDDVKCYFTGELLKRELGFPYWLQIVSVLLSMFWFFILFSKYGKQKGRGSKALRIIFLIIATVPVFGLILYIVFSTAGTNSADGSGFTSGSDYY